MKENGKRAFACPAANASFARRVADFFRSWASKVAVASGSPAIFVLASASVVVWALTGPLFHYSNTWQLVINTATTIVTFLMVFLIQNQQNRDTKAIHLKLDELLCAVRGARSSMVEVEKMSDEELERLQKEFETVCELAKRRSKLDRRAVSVAAISVAGGLTVEAGKPVEALCERPSAPGLAQKEAALDAPAGK